MRKLAVAILDLGNGNYVFQRRDKDAPTSPGLLGLFGGHMEDAEDSLQAVVRELQEETSLQLESSDFEHLTTEELQYDNETSPQSTFHLFKARVGSADFKVFEGERAETYTLEELLARSDVSPSVKTLILKVKERVN